LEVNMATQSWRSFAVKPQVQLRILEDLEGTGDAGELEAETLACLPDTFEGDGSVHGGAKRLAASHHLEVWWFESSSLLVVRAVACDARVHGAAIRFADRLLALLRLRYRLERLN
jgi:hypothetical protein